MIGRKRPAAAPSALRARDVLITTLAEPVILPPGSPARGALCLACDKSVGGELANAVMFLPGSAPGCECGNTAAAAWWAHARCTTTDVDALMVLAQARLIGHGHLGRPAP